MLTASLTAPEGAGMRRAVRHDRPHGARRLHAATHPRAWDNSSETMPMNDDSAFARELRDAADRKPSPFPKLLMGLGNARDARLAVDLTSDYAYEDAYFDAARKLSAGARVGLQVDQDVLPILYLYRHFVELMLKSCIHHLNVHVYAHDPSGVLKRPEHHRLDALLGDLRHLHQKVASYLPESVRLPSAQAQAFIVELAAVDEGFAFRYLLDKKGERTISQDLRVNLDVLDAGMLHVERELMAYRDMVENATEAYDWSDADW